MRILYVGLGWRFTGGITAFARAAVGALADWAGRSQTPGRLDVMALHAERGSAPAERYGIERAGLTVEGYAGQRLQMALTLAARLRRRRYDLIVCEHPNLMPLVAAAAPASSRCVCFIYSFEVWYGLSAVRRLALRRADKLLALSHAAAELTNRMGLRLPPIEVCHPGLEDPCQGTDLQRRPASFPIVLTVGRMMRSERHKNHRALLHAMVDVVRAVPDAMLVVVGEGDDRNEIAALGAELGLGDRLLFTGAVSQAELDSWYRRAWVFAMPAEREGFGLVYLEAMARGLPVVAGACGASLEIIDDGKSGFLVCPTDHQELAQRIVALFEDDRLRAAIGRSGRARFAQHFGSDQFARRLYKALGVEPFAAEKPPAESAA
jgi:phosphatidylinositol alpha-1,6-mannosyltransferase